MNFTLLSNSRFNLPVFGEVRYLSASDSQAHFDDFFLEVKIVRNAAVSYSIMENLGNSGFEPIDWVETTSIPAGYTDTAYDLDKLFVAAGETPVLSVDRTEGVAINGGLTVDGVEVLTAITSLNSGNGANSVVFGNSTHALFDESFTIGSFNEIEDVNLFNGSSTSSLIPDDEQNLFVIGNGTSSTNRSNAFSVNRRGDVNISGSIGGTATELINTIDDMGNGGVAEYYGPIKTGKASTELEYYFVAGDNFCFMGSSRDET